MVDVNKLRVIAYCTVFCLNSPQLRFQQFMHSWPAVQLVWEAKMKYGFMHLQVDHLSFERYIFWARTGNSSNITGYPLLTYHSSTDRFYSLKLELQTFCGKDSFSLDWLILSGRSGTVPTPLVVGLGAACALAQAEMEYDHKYISRLSNKLVQVTH